MELLASEDAGIEAITTALEDAGGLQALFATLTRSPVGLSAAAAAVIDSRRRLVADVRALVATAGTTESDLQPLIAGAHWMFGGKYVGVANRRSLTQLDQYDIPLLTSDGTLHVVELKGPRIPGLVRRHRNHWIVGTDIHEAVSQAMSYVRTLDELGLALQATYAELGEAYKLRRVRATVVIGSAQHVPAATSEQVELALRTYNGHLSRVDVITYDELLDAADRTLNFDNASFDPATDHRLIDVRTPVASPASEARRRHAPTASAATGDPWATTGKSESTAPVAPWDDPWAAPSMVQRPQDEPPF